METSTSNRSTISAIVPTIGRPHSLRRLLESLCGQTCRVDEVIVADGSNNDETYKVVDEYRWQESNLTVKRIVVYPPNTVRQREAAIRTSQGEFLLLLDDDVELEPECVERLLALLQTNPNVVGVTANFNNQSWSQPTRCWQLYLRYILGLKSEAWQGRVVGPLLRFGYNPVPANPQPMDWLGSGNSLVRHSAYSRAGGFSDFFLHRCTTNEDVDFGLKLSKLGRILFCPSARMAHFQAPGGRVAPMKVAEDDLYNRYMVIRCTQGRSVVAAFGQILLYFTIETASNLGGCMRRFRTNGFGARTFGRVRALLRILLGMVPVKTNA